MVDKVEAGRCDRGVSTHTYRGFVLANLLRREFIYSAERLKKTRAGMKKRVGSGPFIFLRTCGGAHGQARKPNYFMPADLPDGFKAIFIRDTALAPRPCERQWSLICGFNPPVGTNRQDARKQPWCKRVLGMQFGDAQYEKNLSAMRGCGAR